MIKRFLIIALLCSSGAALAQDRVLAVLGGTQAGANDGGAVLEVDINTGDAIVLGTPMPGDGLTGAAVTPSGRMYAATNHQGATGAATLIEINPANGSLIAIIGPFTLGGNAFSVQDMTADPVTGQLYIAATGQEASGPAFNEILTVDATTAEATSIGVPDYQNSGGYIAIAFKPDGSLWAKETNAPGYWEVDPTDASILGSFTNTPSNVGSTALGSLSDGRLLLAECCNLTLGNDLYILDTDTGDAELIGTMGGDRRIHDFVVVSQASAAPALAVPTLSQIALILMMMVLAAGGMFALRARQ
jgi:hypothetical protein